MSQEQDNSRAADMMRRIGDLYHVTTTATTPEARYSFNCQRCGRTWTQERDKPPSACPCCGYERWNEPPETRTCARCGHVWKVPQGHPKGKCPQCHSRIWDTPSKRNAKTAHNG